MANSLTTGVSGLRTHQQMLDVVGNNLANANTHGFKSQRVRFADLIYQTLQPATSASSDSVGGTNPSQIGLGVRVTAIDSILQQGSLDSTGNDYDFAIQGNGYFVLSDGVKTTFSRAGAFGVDQDNYLTDLATGLRVQRFGTVGEGTAVSAGFQTAGDSRINIPIGTGLPGQATSSVNMQGNLDASATGPQQHTVTTTQPFLVAGVAAAGTDALSALDSNVVGYVGTDQLLLQGITAAGAAVNATVTVPATVGALLAAINTNFPGSTASLDAAGNIVLQANNTGPSQLSLSISDVAGNTGQTNWFNHPLVETTEGKDGDIVPSAIQFYDSQGRSHSLILSFQKVSDNVWDLTGSIDPQSGTVVDGSIQGITFNDDGSFQTTTGTGTGDILMTFQLNGLTAPQTVQFNLGQTGGFDGLTQFGGISTAAAISQDGHSAGSLTQVAVGKDGTINGVFSNARTIPLAQLALALFANPGGLTREGDNYLIESAQSGPALIGIPSGGGRGTIQQGALEASNVDVALEFTRLIIAQRGFQVNARTITVSDEVLQELANIIR